MMPLLRMVNHGLTMVVPLFFAASIALLLVAVVLGPDAAGGLIQWATDRLREGWG